MGRRLARNAQHAHLVRGEWQDDGYQHHSLSVEGSSRCGAQDRHEGRRGCKFRPAGRAIGIAASSLHREDCMSGTSEARPPRHRARSIGAVLVGFFAVVILSLATDMVLHATGVFPPWGDPVSSALLLLATTYRTIYSVVGCYIAARLAPDRPMRHALALG